MNYFSRDYKKLLAEHYVFDAWQFIVNTQKNINTAKYCYEIINKLVSRVTEEHKDWIDNINEHISKAIEENIEVSINLGYDSLPQYKINIAGINVDYPFLIDKYIKDFFQYTRNAFDSIAQIVNSALLANESINIEKVDFNKITTVLNKNRYSSKFPKTLDWLLKIQQREEFMYLSEFNNRTKHICDSKIIMSQNLLNYDVLNKIGPFYKKGKQFEEQDICVITKTVLDFLEDEFVSFLGILTEEIKLDTFIEGRIHNLKFYFQQIKDNPQSSFTVIYIEVEESIDELPDVLRVLLVNNNEDVISINSDYEEILVRDKKGNYLGQFIMDNPITRDGLYLYRKYKKDNIEGIKAFINHSRKNKLVNPLFVSGKVVRVGFDKTE